MNLYKHPFDIILEVKKFLYATGGSSNELMNFLNIYQPPPEFKYLAKVLIFEKSKDNDFIQKLLEGKVESKQRYKLATSYPVFYALVQFNHHRWSNPLVQQLVISVYKEIFNIEYRHASDIDSLIYYTDAYSIRDIFLSVEEDNFLKFTSLSSSWVFQKKLVEYYKLKLLKLFDQDSSYKRKLARFIDLLSKNRKPGVRKNKHFEKQVSKTEIEVVLTSSTSEDGTGFQTSYPQPGSKQSKTICRIAPKGGAKLSPCDDRLALRGRLNQQASRNIISVIDMNRLTIHSISEYLKFLWVKNKTAYVYNLVLFCTGLTPVRLEKINIEKGKRLRLAEGCHVNLESNVLSYDVLHQPKFKTVIELVLTDMMTKVLVQNGEFFSNILEESRVLAKTFKLHHAGQTPTPERMTSSSALHFSLGIFNEIEVAYLAGDIPARLRAQVHYYPIDCESLNDKFQMGMARATKKLGFKTSWRLKSSKPKIKEGNIGSTYGLALESLKQSLAEINMSAQALQQRYLSQNGMNRVQLIINFINLQNIQLFIIEQLSFCARRFGSKTTYANSRKFKKAWGSEKASAIFAIERKYIPTIDLLNLQLEACAQTIGDLNQLARYYRITCNIKFDVYESPLPIKLTFDTSTRSVKTERLSNKIFYKLLDENEITNFSIGIPERVSPFKHTIAAMLLGKVPQILLDELMNHDRDGLDFCAPWSTGSALSLDLVVDEIKALFNGLDIEIIQFTGGGS